MNLHRPSTRPRLHVAPGDKPSLAATRPFYSAAGMQADTDKADAGLASSLLGEPHGHPGSTQWERGASAFLLSIWRVFIDSRPAAVTEASVGVVWVPTSSW